LLTCGRVTIVGTLGRVTRKPPSRLGSISAHPQGVGMRSTTSPLSRPAGRRRRWWWRGHAIRQSAHWRP
jgi:hypothetical protein